MFFPLYLLYVLYFSANERNNAKISGFQLYLLRKRSGHRISKHQQFTDMMPAGETLPSVKARTYASYLKSSSTVESAIFLLINDKVRGVYDCSSPDKKQPSGVCI